MINFEEEIAKRDARIAELEQQRGGVVLPERDVPAFHAEESPNWHGCIGWNAAIDAVASLNPCRAQAVPDGYVQVPVEPTEIMQDAGCSVMPTVNCHPYDAGMVYKAMLAAAPAAKKESGL